MKLRDWISRHGLSYGAAARALGLSTATTVRRYALGIHIPNRSKMEQIRERTYDEVTPADFYEKLQPPTYD